MPKVLWMIRTPGFGSPAVTLSMRSVFSAKPAITNCGRLERCYQHIGHDPQSLGIGEPESILSRMSGTMYSVGYSVIPMPQQRRCLVASNMTTPDFFLMVNSGHSSVVSKNDDRLWQKNLCIPVLAETERKRKLNLTCWNAPLGGAFQR